MSHSETSDNNVQSILKQIENLNDPLSTENASIDRIISRIDETPIREIRHRLKKHLEETYIQKSRLLQIITENSTLCRSGRFYHYEHDFTYRQTCGNNKSIHA
jgi:hypothetical protein